MLIAKPKHIKKWLEQMGMPLMPGDEPNEWILGLTKTPSGDMIYAKAYYHDAVAGRNSVPQISIGTSFMPLPDGRREEFYERLFDIQLKSDQAKFVFSEEKNKVACIATRTCGDLDKSELYKMVMIIMKVQLEHRTQLMREFHPQLDPAKAVITTMPAHGVPSAKPQRQKPVADEDVIQGWIERFNIEHSRNEVNNWTVSLNYGGKKIPLKIIYYSPSSDVDPIIIVGRKFMDVPSTSNLQFFKKLLAIQEHTLEAKFVYSESAGTIRIVITRSVVGLGQEEFESMLSNIAVLHEKYKSQFDAIA